ncbi:hypothetical protein [Streptomyces sp. bgisy027]|uniref:hypothetical protein n=1 Tax=Streptomyces sp. bgisy027 TaxID=3413770 RepID=UPI003D70B8C2
MPVPAPPPDVPAEDDADGLASLAFGCTSMSSAVEHPASASTATAATLCPHHPF